MSVTKDAKRRLASPEPVVKFIRNKKAIAEDADRWQPATITDYFMLHYMNCRDKYGSQDELALAVSNASDKQGIAVAYEFLPDKPTPAERQSL